MVGTKRITNLKEMLSELVDVADRLEPNGSTNSSEGLYIQNQRAIRVVYGLETSQSAGTNTQYIRLTNEDVDSIKEVLGSL